MRETFGPFRLLEKIDEDVLGEIYCAARQVEDGREQIETVRIFDRAGMDPERFLQRVAGRRFLTDSVASVHLAASRELGAAEGRAYDAFKYQPGRTLASVIRRAKSQLWAFPVDVALFIVGRLAAGLQAAYREEVDGEILTHGFVLPELVMVSEEGGVKLSCLEAAPALKDFRGTAATFATILPYLAPEARTGEDSHPSDDVYSLGALLYELLTLEPLSTHLDLRAETSNIPAELRYFLDRSVAPRFRRIQSVVEWLRELKALVVHEGWAASSPDLAAFLAGIDDRLQPPRPDTTHITAGDRAVFADAIVSARAEAGPEADEAQAAAEPELAGDDEIEKSATAAEISAPEEPAAEKPVAETETGEPASEGKKGSAYDTTELERNLLPLEPMGELVRTTDVKRAGSLWGL